MRILSFYNEDQELKPVDVELMLWPGLPTIQFVGGADLTLKESAARIKSAIKAAGFQFPVAQQILVNLKPTHIRKSSRGLELAVALAYLWATEQVEAPELGRVTIYGELGLRGQVEEPADLARARVTQGEVVLTGAGSASAAADFPVRRLSHLADLRAGGNGFYELEADTARGVPMSRPPPVGNEFVSAAEARLLEIIGVGGHHTLLAGPAGSGKSTFARLLHTMLPDLSITEERELRREQRDDPEAGSWRPLIEPHSTTPRMAMLGGGNPPRPGEIVRAHRGLLVLDELLEFDGEVLEALRGPFETGELRVGRLAGVRKYAVDCVIAATTNLCPCGDLVPGLTPNLRCRYSAKRCRSYGERLSGPLLDRFQVLHYPPRKSPAREIRVAEVRAKVLRVQAWQRERGRNLSNRRLSGADLWAQVSPTVREIGFTSQALSERRRLAALRVARSIADLDLRDEIRLEDFNEAMPWAVDNFSRLHQWQMDLRH
ncbi:MAG: ATP-binding protein [Bdellovibrionaceae bacterium]|nr:ATP-binding protein [Pseudobdellovibrionaceae bacterium]